MAMAFARACWMFYLCLSYPAAAVPTLAPGLWDIPTQGRPQTQASLQQMLREEAGDQPSQAAANATDELRSQIPEPKKLAPVGSLCRDSASCVSNLCENNTCVARAELHGLAANGFMCAADADCASGVCLGQVCIPGAREEVVLASAGLIKPPSPCPNKCSQRGVCMQGKCVCVEGWSGDDCSFQPISKCDHK